MAEVVEMGPITDKGDEVEATKRKSTRARRSKSNNPDDSQRGLIDDQNSK